MVNIMKNRLIFKKFPESGGILPFEGLQPPRL
jgi:hypothetical protein